MKVLNIHLKNYDSQYSGKDLMSLEEVVLYMNGEYTPFNAKVFGINKELQPHFSEDTVEARIELKQKESIFDNPRWVTFDASQDLMGCFLDVLIDGKDYKVSKTKTLTGGDKNYLLENGVRAHESYFHKVTPEDLKPVVGIEEEESFDKLIYSSPKYMDNNTYYVIEKDKLSDEQWIFVIDNVPLDNEPEDFEVYLNLDPDTQKWFGETSKSEKQDIYTSFNQIFQEVTTHQD